MNAHTTFPLTEARRRLFEFSDQVQFPGQTLTFTQNGKPKVVMVSSDEYDSLIETLEILHDHPDILQSVEKSRKEYKAGKFITLDQLCANLQRTHQQASRKTDRSSSRKRSTARTSRA